MDRIRLEGLERAGLEHHEFILVAARHGEVVATTIKAHVEGVVAGLDLPTWVGHGDVDRLVPVWASEPLESVAAVRRVYVGLGHEILNEPVGLDIADEMAAWIEQTLGL